MIMKAMHIKRFVLVLISTSVMACSYMPSTSEVFADKKEDYKKAHELPSLEVPPGLTGGDKEDEYVGVTKGSAPVRTEPVIRNEPVTRTATVETAPLEELSKTTAEIVTAGSVAYLLVHDNFRNTWLKTVIALEELGYDIEDVNREEGLIYLNIGEAEGSSGMFSALTFWKSGSVTEYLVAFDQYSDGVTVEVQDDSGLLVNDDVSKQIYADLLRKLTQ
jgi:uncharacterized lipoprotein